MKDIYCDMIGICTLRLTRAGKISISTHQIGKKSKAHLLTYSISRKKQYCGVAKINKKEIIRIIMLNLKSGNA